MIEHVQRCRVGFRTRDIAGRQHRFHSGARELVSGRLSDERRRIRKLSVPVSQDPGPGGASVTALGVEHLSQDLFADTLDILTGPHRFDEVEIVILSAGIEPIDPVFNRDERFIPVAVLEFLLHLLTHKRFAAGEMCHQFLQRHALDRRRLDQRTLLVRDAPDAAVVVIPTRVTKVVLSVVDDRVIPVRHVDAAIRSHLHIDRAKVGVLRRHERLEHVGVIAGTVLDELITDDGAAFETPAEQVATNVIADVCSGRKITAALLLG